MMIELPLRGLDDADADADADDDGELDDLLLDKRHEDEHEEKQIHHCHWKSCDPYNRALPANRAERYRPRNTGHGIDRRPPVERSSDWTWTEEQRCGPNWSSGCFPDFSSRYYLGEGSTCDRSGFDQDYDCEVG
jgi:hypothetical protein